MNKTSIEWTHRPETGGAAGGFTWNPIRAILHTGPGPGRTGTFCTRISPGCKNCYASTINKRFGTGAEYTVPELANHEFYISEKILEEPLKRKKPATIFVGDMFDLFHEAIPTEMITNVIWTMMRPEARQHTFQILTKRAERMRWILNFAFSPGGPPSHIHVGVSVEDQPRANERIPDLIATRAVVHFLSVEPQLEAVDFRQVPGFNVIGFDLSRWWVICGGESGPGARPFNLAWAESLLEQCRNARVPFFMKQIGSQPCVTDSGVQDGKPWSIDTWLDIRDRKGGDPAEWPERLRVREFPA